MTTRRSLATIVVVFFIVVVGIALLYAMRAARSQAAPAAVSSTAPSSVAASPSSSPAPSTSPALPPGTFENAFLGYRITLPVSYRRMSASVNPGATEVLGGEAYTTSTLEQVRDDCRSGAGQGVGGQMRYRT